MQNWFFHSAYTAIMEKSPIERGIFMIKQLRKIFSSLVLYNEISNNNLNKFKWFMTDEKQVIGIDKKELTKKDTTLLDIFLRPYNVSIPEMTAEEQQWKTYISTDITDSTN